MLMNLASPLPPRIDYGYFLDGLNDFLPTVRCLIGEHGSRRVCDVGGGANPLLSIEDLRAFDLDYTVLDISAEELEKAPPGYQRLCGDVCRLTVPPEQRFDLVFSRMVAEHVESAEQFHRAIHSLLVPGGIAVHLFPTLFTVPFLVNRILPETVSRQLLKCFSARDDHKEGKFPAYYNRCRGPSPGQFQFFADLDYEVLAYKAYFGHGYYRRIPVLRTLHSRLTQALVNHPLPALTSYACVVLRTRQPL